MNNEAIKVLEKQITVLEECSERLENDVQLRLEEVQALLAEMDNVLVRTRQLKEALSVLRGGHK